jgi:hypothetical protein
VSAQVEPNRPQPSGITPRPHATIFMDVLDGSAGASGFTGASFPISGDGKVR